MAQEYIGRRMDFDVEIIVRLYWRGVPMRWLPTAVTYPLDGVSHFRMVRDNARMVALQLRLFGRHAAAAAAAAGGGGHREQHSVRRHADPGFVGREARAWRAVHDVADVPYREAALRPPDDAIRLPLHGVLLCRKPACARCLARLPGAGRGRGAGARRQARAAVRVPALPEHSPAPSSTSRTHGSAASTTRR